MSRPVLRVALAESERHSPLYGRLPEFTATTGIEVEVAFRLTLPELVERLETAPESERLALVSAHSDYLAGLAPRLAPLDGLLPPEEVAAFDGLALARSRLDGRLYQLPRAVEARLLYYRADFFDDRREKQWFAEASGGRELRVPGSWEELAAAAQYFTREGKLHGFAFPGRGPGLVRLFAEITAGAGGAFWGAGGPRFYSRAGEWALSLLRDLYRRWEAVPPETPEWGEQEVSRAFRLGKCALACDYTDTARLLCDPTFSAVAGWHGVALYPAGAEGRAVWSGTPGFAIPAGCPEPEAAVELLRFLTGVENQVRDGEHGAVPARTAALERLEAALLPGTQAHRRLALARETLAGTLVAAPAVPGWRRAEARLWPLLRQAVMGELEPAAALEAGARAAEEAAG
jgi:multiple sugar transport system substrate-binding protein